MEHTVKAFDEDITRLRGLIAEMGGLAEVSIGEAMDALIKGSDELAAAVIARDKRIDSLEAEVDRLAVRIIALRAAMAEVAAEMVHDVLTAYAARDPKLACEVVERDEKVDAFYNSIFRNLVSHMMENPATISSAAQLLFVARNLERIGDHATNVAEMVYYAATGDYLTDREDRTRT
jgi:phosphate transport system protein